MTYIYVCENNHTKEIECAMKDPLPEKVICEECKLEMHQDYKGKVVDTNIIIPYGFTSKGSDLYQYQHSYGKHNAHEKQLY